MKGISQRPQVVVDSSGVVHVVWYDNGGAVASYPNFALYHCRLEGERWSRPANTALMSWYITDDASMILCPGLAADFRGNVHLVWVDIYDYTQDLFHSRWDRKTWSKPRNISTKPERPCEEKIETDADGNLHVTWHDNGIVWYCRSDGQVWKKPFQMSEGGTESSLPTLCVSRGGDVYVAWDAELLGTSQVFYRRSHAGIWTEVRRSTESPGNSVAAAIGHEASGVVHFAWMDDTSGNFEIFHRRGLPSEPTK